ncbi:MAG: diacylglycerol kinase [Eggerthellaceae bacterium]|nr:diacylglycerol kinase [Eggerthellaceae bacterium]
MKLLVLNNISAGPGDGAIYDFVRMFSKAGDEVLIRSADEQSDFPALLADASRFDVVVASGGDGTIAHVCYELRYTNIPILVYPSGTANLIAQNILHPFEAPSLAALARECRTMRFDLGEFDFGEDRVGFMMMAGCGFDATMMSAAKPMKDRLGPVAYFRAAFDNASPQVADISLDVDGQHVETKGVGVVCMNFSKVQFDVSFGLANLPSDGLIDACILATQNAWNLLPTALGAALDRSGKTLGQSDILKYYRGREIRVETNPPLPVEYDGDAIERTTPFTVRALPGAARLIVSQECIDEFGEAGEQH